MFVAIVSMKEMVVAVCLTLGTLIDFGANNLRTGTIYAAVQLTRAYERPRRREKQRLERETERFVVLS